jgi:hypothetical protein
VNWRKLPKINPIPNSPRPIAASTKIERDLEVLRVDSYSVGEGEAVGKGEARGEGEGEGEDGSVMVLTPIRKGRCMPNSVGHQSLKKLSIWETLPGNRGYPYFCRG